jgi:uncharacterized protein DUF6941
MNITFALFADAANLSQEGKLNILGVFDAVQVGAVPAVHPRAFLVVRLKGQSQDVGSHRVTLTWLNPEGTELWSTTGELNIEPAPAGVTEMDFPLIASVDLPIDRPGTFTMRIAVDDNAVAEVPLRARAGMAGPIMPAGGGLVS